MLGPWPDWLENNTIRDGDRAATAGAYAPDLHYRFDIALSRDASTLLFARHDPCKMSAIALPQVEIRIALLISNRAYPPEIGMLANFRKDVALLERLSSWKREEARTRPPC